MFSSSLNSSLPLSLLSPLSLSLSLSLYIYIFSSDVYGVIKILLAKNIPHNLFILKRSSFNAKDSKKERSNEYITIILVPRKPAYGLVKMFLKILIIILGVKTLYEDRDDHLIPPFFVAACEIGGFVPIIGKGEGKPLQLASSLLIQIKLNFQL